MSSAPLRAVAALGGALGMLPMIPIARSLAMRLSGPPRLMGMELAAYDFKSATYAEAAVLLAAMPLAAFCFGGALPRWLERRGAGRGGAWPGILFAAAWPAWRYGARPKLALAAGALLAAAAVGAALARRRTGVVPARETSSEAVARDAPDPPEERGWIAPALVLVALSLCGWRFFWTKYGAIQFFEDGNLLAPAQEYLRGGRPFVDTYPIHGWGADGGVDALLFRIASPSLEVFRIRRAAMAALAMSALALACWMLFRRRLWSAVAFLLGLALCPYFSERQLPAFAALAALVAAARSGRRGLWFLAGILGAVNLFFALDFGVFVLAGGAVTAAAMGLSERRGREAAASAGLLILGALAGALPFLAALARDGALGAFLRVSFVELPASISDVWGRPAGTAMELFRRGTLRDAFGTLFAQDPETPVRWLFPALLLSLAAAVFLFRLAARPLDALDRGALAATAVAMIAVRGVLGRADSGHLALYGVTAALPAAWLLYRAAHARRYRAALVLALAVPITLRLDPLPALMGLWAGLRPGARLMQQAECQRPPLRGGRATVPCEQAKQLEELERYVDAHLRPGETFFDYSNQAALYFLLDRRSPIRFVAAPLYEPEPMQREVIAELERERPPLAILPFGEWTDSFDAVSNRRRTPLVAAYVDAAYPVREVAGGRYIGLRREGLRREPAPDPGPPPRP